MKINIKNKKFLKNFCKIIKKNNYTILLINCDKIEILNKYKNITLILDKTVKNKRITFLILHLLAYKNNKKK